MGARGLLNALGGNGGPPAAGKVPAPVRASGGPSVPIDELLPRGSAEGHEPAPGVRQEVLDYLCTLATQASTDDVIDAQTVLLDSSTGPNGGGYHFLAATAEVGTVAVLNLGARMMAVVASQPQGGPPPQGQGQTFVAPGQLVTLPLGGSYHTIYGALGDAATVVRFASTRDPHVGGGGGGAFTPQVGNPVAGAGTVFYTAPFPGAIPAYLTDINVANSGATVARVKLFDGTVAGGLLLLDVSVLVGDTRSLTFDKAPRLISTGLLTCAQISGDAGQPKVQVGVQ